ncbi:hypothetical protein ACTFIU_005566 [Dictyostelium citrinum]
MNAIKLIIADLETTSKYKDLRNFKIQAKREFERMLWNYKCCCQNIMFFSRKDVVRFGKVEKSTLIKSLDLAFNDFGASANLDSIDNNKNENIYDIPLLNIEKITGKAILKIFTGIQHFSQLYIVQRIINEDFKESKIIPEWNQGGIKFVEDSPIQDFRRSGFNCKSSNIYKAFSKDGLPKKIKDPIDIEIHFSDITREHYAIDFQRLFPPEGPS